MAFIRYLFLILFISCCFFTKLIAQDLHFSLFGLSPLNVNATNTGLFDGLQRATAIYRSQWASVKDPYRTVHISYDRNFLINRLSYDQIGAGIAIIDDKSAGGAYHIFKLLASGAFHRSYDNTKQNISIGFQSGFTQYTLRYQDLLYPDQISENALDPGIPTNESFGKGSLFRPEVSAGVVWSYHSLGNYLKRLKNRQVLRRDTKESEEYKFGVSLHHLNNPKINTLDEVFRLKPRFVFFGESRMNLNYNIHLYPKFVYMKQRSANTLMIGSDIEYMLHNKTDDAVLVGARYRTKDAIIAVAGYKFGDYEFFFAYDINISTLAVATRGRGAFEIGVAYIQGRSLKINCPKWKDY